MLILIARAGIATRILLPCIGPCIRSRASIRNTPWSAARGGVATGPRFALGAGEIGFYFIEHGVLQMCTEAGKPMGKKVALAGDAARIAGRLTREAWAKR